MKKGGNVVRLKTTLPLPFQLAATWTPGCRSDLAGWLVFEKLDGVRAMWDGHKRQLLSRNGLVFNAPLEFVKNFPSKVILDGELWIDRGMFADTVSVLRSKPASWDGMVRYWVFDGVDKKCWTKYTLSQRLQDMQERYGGSVDVLPWTVLENSDEIVPSMQKVISAGGEGLILRDPNSYYSPGRKAASISPMLKVKPLLDAEAVVVSVDLLPGRRGSVLVQEKNSGVEFRISAGFKDVNNFPPPKVGATITFGYCDKHPDTGVPRCARYLRLRQDVDWT